MYRANPYLLIPVKDVSKLNSIPVKEVNKLNSIPVKNVNKINSIPVNDVNKTKSKKLDPHGQKSGMSDKILWNSNLLCHVDQKYSYH